MTHLNILCLRKDRQKVLCHVLVDVQSAAICWARYDPLHGDDRALCYLMMHRMLVYRTCKAMTTVSKSFCDHIGSYAGRSKSVLLNSTLGSALDSIQCLLQLATLDVLNRQGCV